MTNSNPLHTIRVRKQRIYSFTLTVGILAVISVWIAADLSESFSQMDPILLPIIVLLLSFLLIINRDIDHLNWVEYGIFSLTAIPLLLSLGEAMLKEPLDLVDLGDLFYWFAFVYLMGFLVLRPSMDWIILGTFLVLTISTGFIHYGVHDFALKDRTEALFLARFYLAQVIMFAIAFSLFRLNESIISIRAAKENWEELALTDSLTGLSNRMAFTAQLDMELAQVKRYERNSSILMMDIDGFKNINDQFGHAVGDQVLIEIAKVISNNLRESDFAARYAGDEFVLLLPETGEKAAINVAERIQAGAALIELERPIKVEMSIGISGLAGAIDREDIFRQVDERMYAKKRRR
jgi:diguanylate cyclase (GGDEF)-like protein